MNRHVRLVIVGLVLLAAAVLAWRVWAPRAEDANVLAGYIEGDDLYLSSPVAGSVTAMKVVKGQRVAAGAPLFAMDPSTLDAQRGQAQARVEQSQSQISAAEAQAQQAAANVAAARAVEANARRDFDRFAGLQRANPQAVAAQQVDQARAALANATAQRQGVEKAAAAASVQAQAARAATIQAQAGLREAGVRLGQLDQVAPAAGRIEDVFFQRGEWAGPNQPVVSLLPDGQVKVRFYVPEKAVQAYQPGGVVQFACDGCSKGLTAKISYVSPRSEFTPPVIYSRNSRDKLVFLVEAVPVSAGDLRPGLPVDVQPLKTVGGPGR